MSQYTYTLNPNQMKEESHTYKQSELEKMTVFRLQEICRKERLVIPSAQRTDREGLIHLIMRFRGQKEYRHIQDFCEGVYKRVCFHLMKRSRARTCATCATNQDNRGQDQPYHRQCK